MGAKTVATTFDQSPIFFTRECYTVPLLTFLILLPVGNIMNKKNSALDKLRHSVAHLLAHAVKELFPTTKLTIGPVTDEGFFYDFLPERNFKEEDLPLIEQKMREIAARNLPITQRDVSKAEARKLFKDNPFKLELIEGIEGDTVGLSEQGTFFDLCKGGHVASTGEINYFKLLTISGSYWRADRENQALQRITGTAFLTEKDFNDYERMIEEAKLYDHRRLGKQMDLFSFHDEGPGFAFFHPKGASIIEVMKKYIHNELTKARYQQVITPVLLSDELWKQSGHYAHYKDKMYFCEADNKSYALRPMNCPCHCLVFKSNLRSYRELPLRLAEFGLDHRFELSGVMHGLLRLRAFTQDDAHIFCMPSQIEGEVLGNIKLAFDLYKKYGFEKVIVGIATRPADSMGSDEIWEISTNALKQALNKANLPYEIYEGEGAFYGPKIEFRVADSMNRLWQCSTVQVDFCMPENFDLTYVSQSGKLERPVMIHRAIYGSIERFLGVLLEHYKGNLPFWLAPIQVSLLTITDNQKDYAATIAADLEELGIRVQVDESSDPIAGKIKRAQTEHVPWMLVLGKQEQANGTVTLRYRDGKQEQGLSIEALLTKAREENN
jgi:threonyl-tRNA synthetase